MSKNAEELIWAVERWNAEVRYRPIINVHYRTLDETWRQVMRHFGGDPDELVGPPPQYGASAQTVLKQRDPTPEELESLEFNAIWKAIKGWDISRESNGVYAGATGTDVCAILDAIKGTVSE